MGPSSAGPHKAESPSESQTWAPGSSGSSPVHWERQIGVREISAQFDTCEDGRTGSDGCPEAEMGVRGVFEEEMTPDVSPRGGLLRSRS